jgi:phage terminase Nu1 subunit (DNA packaging protein)
MSSSTPAAAATEGAVLRAKYSFKGENANELAFKKGDIIRLLAKDESGWAQGELEDGAKGWFPIDFAITPAQYEALEAKKTRRKRDKKDIGERARRVVGKFSEKAQITRARHSLTRTLAPRASRGRTAQLGCTTSNCSCTCGIASATVEGAA